MAAHCRLMFVNHFNKLTSTSSIIIYVSSGKIVLPSVAILARGRRVTRPPFYINKKKFNTMFAFIFFTYPRTYFCFYVAKCQSVGLVILFLNAFAPK